LTNVLDGSAAQGITLVAPAGYGKTMLAREWLQGREAVVWYRLALPCLDLAAFAIGLADAAEEALPEVAATLHQRAPTTPSPVGLARALAHSIRGWAEEGLLVIDDYHFASESEAIDEFLESLLRNSALRLLVTTRSRPPWSSARRLVHGHVMEIGATQLAMTAEEAEQLLGGHAVGNVRDLVEKANGWPAILGLASAAARTDAPQHTVSDALFRYFAEEVLNQQPAHVQRFMLEASVRLRVTATADTDALDHLLNAGLLDHEGDDFRFHPLLQDFLRQRLWESDSERAEELAKRAIEDAKAGGDYEEAFHLSLSFRPDDAIEVASGAVAELVRTGRVATAERWVELCGSRALERPSLVLAKAAAALRRGQFADSLALTRDLADRLPEEDPQAWRAAYLTAQALHLLADKVDAMIYARRAVERAQEDADRPSALLLACLCAARLELPEADRYLAALAQLGGDDTSRLRFAAAQLVAAVKKGSLAGVWDTTEPVLPLVERAPNPLLQTHVLACASYLCMLRADYRRAATLAERSMDICREYEIGFALDFSLLCRAFADIGSGAFKEARARLRALARRAAAHEDADFHLLVRIAELKLALARGTHARLADLSPLPPTIEAQATRAYVGAHRALLALAAAADGDWERASERAERALALSGSAEAVHYARFADAIARIERREAATGALGALLRDIECAEALDAFVVAYRACPTLLSHINKGSWTPGLQQATSAANDGALLARDARSSANVATEAMLPLLTPREAEVLELLGEGLSNDAIAAALVISPATAKVHVHNILNKLGARTRTEAVRRADLSSMRSAD
jgi:LuxR family transcriptional regulator, maltose regulon positive regulatory protein